VLLLQHSLDSRWRRGAFYNSVSKRPHKEEDGEDPCFQLLNWSQKVELGKGKGKEDEKSNKTTLEKGVEGEGGRGWHGTAEECSQRN
jgi:hypothetical protein